ncbi:MAG: pyridoxamine 5'-phosphate oxidase family protein [Flavisolibacter sp.]|nr:pyridoxamine 5'-phosphate oxidase family protein [Flavisolibacter sp.]
MLGALQPQQIEEVLKTQLVGRIGCYADGETYIVPISYAYDGTYIYCHTEEGKKTAMMRKNPSVCFQTDEMGDMANWRSVIVQGVYEELNEKEERNFAMQTLLNRYLPFKSSITTHLGEHCPFHPDNTNEIKGVVFRIAINKKFGRFESSGESPNIPG